MAYPATTVNRISEPFEETSSSMWGLVEVFILIQFLWGALLFLPGAQSFRMSVRILPYFSSLALFAFYYGNRQRYRMPAAGKFVVIALLLLVINLAHPQTQLMAGAAQCVFQFCIVAPVFWAGKAVKSPRYLNRLLWLIFIVNAANSLVGLLQIYFPQYFMPPEFSSLAQSMNRDYVEALSYQGASGQMIIRPPGLSDMPAGAAVAGMTTALMGIALSMRREWGARTRTFCLAMSGVGMVVLYLTQVRSLFLMMVAAICALLTVVVRRGQRREAVWASLTSLALVVGAFLWAISLGGKTVADRFFGITEVGLFNSFQSNRGFFVEQTINTLLFEYPLGAGVGRWGMMTVYFGDLASIESPPIHVEIQMTGWLLDGGVLMMLFYGSAVVSALLYCYRRAVRSADIEMVSAARIIFCFNLIIAGTTLAGPSFNTQLGIQFWFLTAALHGCGVGLTRRPRDARRQRGGAMLGSEASAGISEVRR